MCIKNKFFSYNNVKNTAFLCIFVVYNYFIFD